MYAFVYTCMLIHGNIIDEALNWVNNVLPRFICNIIFPCISVKVYISEAMWLIATRICFIS